MTDFSIVFATFRRESILERTLAAYCEIHTRHSWELVVVDNAGRAETRSVLAGFRGRLPLRVLEETTPGKNSAINAALPHLTGELILFTDDDILPAADLLDRYHEAAQLHPDCSVFGGGIHPDRELPGWIDIRSRRVRAALACLDLGDVDRPIPLGDVWGGNMLLRREVFDSGLRFSPAVGPRGDHYIVGGETEFLARLEALGYGAVYVAGVRVLHQIRPEQLTLGWMRRRAFKAGRGAYRGAEPEPATATLLGLPRYLVRLAAANVASLLSACCTLDKRRLNLACMDLYFNVGRMVQSRRGDGTGH